MSKSKITGVINAKNESRYIAQAIRSLQAFSDEIIVADMASTDDTAAIARSLGARVIQVPDFGFVEPARALAVDAATHEWIFILDADEIVPPGLASEMVRLAEDGDVEIVSIPELNFMIGDAVRYSGWSPDSDRHIRFFRKGSVVLSDVIHVPIQSREQRKVLELAAKDDLSIHHFNYTDWSSFLAKLDRYTTIEARQRVDNGETIGAAKVIWMCLKEFLRRFVKRSAYRDGYRGYVLTSLMVTYQLLIYAKTRQLRERGDEAAILDLYAELARDVSERKDIHFK